MSQTQENPADKEKEIAELIESLPPKVRAAFEMNGPEAVRAFSEAMSELPEEESAEIVDKLTEAGILASAPDGQEIMDAFDPMLRAIAGIARNELDANVRLKVLKDLAELKGNGWKLEDAAKSIWDGERSLETLCKGMDRTHQDLIARILELIEAPSPEQLLAEMPQEIQNAFDLEGDDFRQAMVAALDKMPREEADEVFGRLRSAGLIG
jgi:hypothetical protein